MRVAVNGLVAHGAEEILPSVDGRQAAEFAEGRVAGQAHFAVPLEVKGRQVDSVASAGFAEQHGRHFGGDEIVKGEGGLIGHAQVELVQHARLVQLVRLADGVGQGSVGEVAMLFAPSFHVGGQDRVAETEGRGGERGQDPRVDRRIVSIPVALQSVHLFN